MSQKFLYVNTDGDYEEKLAYITTDYVSTSSGAGDAGKPIVLNGSGQIDSTMLNDSDIAHDSTSGAAASTVHTSFPLLTGTRAFTGIQSYDSHKTFTSDAQMVDKKYVDDAVATAGTSAEWFDSVIDRWDASGSLPAGPSSGDRYLCTVSGNGWTADRVYEWDGVSAWNEQIPTTGTYVSVDDETNGLYYYGGSSWTLKYYESTTASLGCEKVGVDIRADIYSSGGIKLVGNELAVEPNDFAGAGLVDDGSDNLAIDWATVADWNVAKALKSSDLVSTTTGYGASIIGLEDSGGLFTTDNVEAALAEVMGDVNAVEDNTITSPNSTISVAGTVGGNNQTVDISWATSANWDVTKAVKADDLHSTTTGEGASIIGIEDAGAYTSQTTVEGALQEIYGKIDGYGTTYTVGAGGVSKGSLVYISANDTVLPYSDLTATQYNIGLAASAQAASQQVKILGNDNIITNVIAGATAGTRYYWNGSGWSTTASTTSGQHVWLGGVAKNATDLQIELRYVKKNA